jgi:hypothetical protein
MQKKNKIYNIHDKAPTPPLKPNHTNGKHQFPPTN